MDLGAGPNNFALVKYFGYVNDAQNEKKILNQFLNETKLMLNESE